MAVGKCFLHKIPIHRGCGAVLAAGAEHVGRWREARQSRRVMGRWAMPRAYAMMKSRGRTVIWRSCASPQAGARSQQTYRPLWGIPQTLARHGGQSHAL